MNNVVFVRVSIVSIGYSHHPCPLLHLPQSFPQIQDLLDSNHWHPLLYQPHHCYLSVLTLCFCEHNSPVQSVPCGSVLSTDYTSTSPAPTSSPSGNETTYTDHLLQRCMVGTLALCRGITWYSYSCAVCHVRLAGWAAGHLSSGGEAAGEKDHKGDGKRRSVTDSGASG